MKLERIFAIYIRHMYMMRRSFDKMFDAFYWVTIDLFLWGLTSVYFQRFSPDAQNVIFMFISGVIFWTIVNRTQTEISLNLLEELWNKNLVNIFVSPLTFKEWITSIVLLSMTKGIISFIFGSFIAFLLYKVNLFMYTIYLVPFIVLLFLSSLWVGFFISGIILRFGTRVQTLGWTLIWLVSPFSAIYFPLDALPAWAQIVSKIIPTSYVFEEARNYMRTGTVHTESLLISLTLNIVYIIFALFFLKNSFQKVLTKGLVKVY